MLRNIVIVVFFSSLLGCGNSEDIGSEAVVKKDGSVTFSEITREITLNSISTVQTTIASSTDSRPIIFSSSNESIASINAQGLIVIRSMGITTISATKIEDAEYFVASDNYELTIMPASIQAITISGQNELVNLSWSRGIEGSQYNLYLANESFSSIDSLRNYNTLDGAQLFEEIPLSTLTKTLTGLENNSPYFFIITAVYNQAESLRSVEVSHIPSAFNATTFTPIPTNTDVLMPDFPGDYVDPNFNTKVIRLTDRVSQSEPLLDGNGNRVTRGNSHPYPKTQVWNSDDTMLRMRYRLFDANTLEELSLTDGVTDLSALYYINGGLSEMKWSSVDPNVYYGISGSQFWKGTIDREQGTIALDLVNDFNEDSYDNFTLGKFEGNIDFNDEFVVFAARKTGQKYLTAIIYNIKTNQIIKKKEFSEISWPDQGQVFDWLSISPHAGHILFSTNDSIKQYDLNLDKVRDLATSGGHGDLGIDQQGSEVYVQFEFGVDSGIWMYQLSDGSRVRLLPRKYNGGHISCRNHQRLGWCYASTTEEGYKEVIAIRLDTSGPEDHEINRFVQTHMSYNSLAGVSPDGKSILFSSDWGDEDIHAVDRDSFLLRLK